MTDHFALLNEPRRPWLDAEALKEKFHTLTAAQHPDVNATGDFTAINNAYQILSDPVKRLRHFLELECPSELSRARQIPAELGDLFMQIGALRQRLDAFLKKHAAVASPLAQALLEPEKMSLIENLEQQLALLNERQVKLLDELRAIDTRWDEQKSFAQLGDIAHSLSFIAKWGEQLREGMVKLSL